MFDWLRKKPLTAGEVKAYQSGQDFGAQMAQAFIAYQKKRFGPVHDNYLNVLRERLQNAVRSEDAPPLLIAKIEGDLFVENLDKLKMQMFDETIAAMADWLNIAQQLDLRPQIEKTIADSVFEFCENLGADAEQVVMDYNVVLRDADAAWRRRYPDKVAQFTSNE
jgi:hypothetical protein